jgi:hypothetical protein
MPEAGWYDDPQGGGGRRWWDGERWSEHTTPPPGSMPAASATPPPPPGAPPAATGWEQQTGAGAGGWQASTTPAAGTGGPAPATKGGAGKLVAVILALVVVVGVGIAVAVLLSAGSDDPEVVATDVIAGGERTVSVPVNGSWDMEMDLPAGLVVIDVRGLDGFDPVLELYDSAGNQVARNDDRSSDHEARYGGGFFDSLIEVEIPAGRYRIVIDGFAGEGGEATIAFPVTGG